VTATFIVVLGLAMWGAADLVARAFEWALDIEDELA
jgi:hypothetical protein